VNEVIQRFRDALTDHLALLQEDGEPLPHPTALVFSIDTSAGHRVSPRGEHRLITSSWPPYDRMPDRAARPVSRERQHMPSGQSPSPDTKVSLPASPLIQPSASAAAGIQPPDGTLYRGFDRPIERVRIQGSAVQSEEG
jgi:hypothetical protein